MIKRDTINNICKFHNIKRDDIKKNYEKDSRYKVSELCNSNITIMIVAELWLNHQKLEPDIKTATIHNLELG